MKALLSHSGAPDVVGHTLALSITDVKARTDFLRQCLSIIGDLERKVDLSLHGFLLSVDDGERGTILSAVAEGMDIDRVVRLFRCAPVGQDTWRLLDRYEQKNQGSLLAGK